MRTILLMQLSMKFVLNYYLIKHPCSNYGSYCSLVQLCKFVELVQSTKAPSGAPLERHGSAALLLVPTSNQYFFVNVVLVIWLCSFEVKVWPSHCCIQLLHATILSIRYLQSTPTGTGSLGTKCQNTTQCNQIAYYKCETLRIVGISLTGCNA